MVKTKFQPNQQNLSFSSQNFRLDKISEAAPGGMPLSVGIVRRASQ